MGKKRKCRMTEEERQIHEEAVKLRKMTDTQLCQYIDGLRDEAYDDGFNSGRNQAKPAVEKSNGIEEFLQRLDTMSGTGNGIGKSTVYKLRKFAEKEGCQ